MNDIQRFLAGFKAFQQDYLGAKKPLFKSLTQGQRPKAMMIGCCDSRVDPAILTHCDLGDLFTVRNVANLVPPCEHDDGQHGVSAALEFAVCHLNVEHIIVMGHAQCGGVQALMADDGDKPETGFISRWMSLAAPARKRVLAELPHEAPDVQQRAVEQAVVLLSLENLRSFPFVDQRVTAGTLELHGWYFDLVHGQLLEYQADQGLFQALSQPTE